MSFWIIAIALALTVVALLTLALVRARQTTLTSSSAESDLRVYRDQLKEVDRDVTRGVLTTEESEQVRLEISRRILDADRQAGTATDVPVRSPKVATYLGLAAMAVVLIGGSFGLYRTLGAPGYPDLPLAKRIELAEIARANRPGQDQAEAGLAAQTALPTEIDPKHLELVERLRKALANRPDDLTGYTLLARNEAALGNFPAARRAQSRVIDLMGDRATAADYTDLADMMILAAGGYVSPEAEAALLEALRRDPLNGTALYYYGLLEVQTGRSDQAFAIWRPLLERSDPAEPWFLPIRAQIEDVARLAGVRYDPPPPPEAAPLRGPSADDIAMAEEMSDEDRAAMIEGMVAGLSDRLANEGGSAEEWARLITALGVLGRTDEARAIADEAMTAFASEPAALPLIEAARVRAGLEE